MVVVSRGKIQEYQIQCGKCKSEIRFIESEENYRYSNGGYFSHEERWNIICPVCKCSITTRTCIDDNYYDWRQK